MAEDLTRTLEEVITGFSGGQATASMLGGSVMTPLGAVANMPAPPPVPVFTPPPPPVLPNYIQQPAAPANPAGMVNPSQAYAANAVHAPAMGMGAGPVPMMATSMPPMQPPPMQPFQAPPGMPPGYGAGMQQGLFAQGMGLAQQNQIMNPAMAQYMSMQGGMMPDTNMMMSAQYGNMRRDVLMDRRTPVPIGLPGSGGGVPNAFLPIDSFQRTRPALQFNRGFDSALYQGLETSRLLEQGYDSYAKSVAGLAVNAVATPFTTAAGAAIGGFVAGPGGAIQGGELGMLAGQFANELPGVNAATQAVFRPAIQRRADSIQMQYASRQFLIGGGRDLDVSGTGLSGLAAQNMTRGFDTIAAESGGALTRKDAVNMMQAGGEQGLLDWAQNSDQIVKTVKTMSGVLGTFAEITGDPDFMNNIKKMGALSRMGIGLNDMDTAVRNMDQYARMAGMDVDQLMQNEGLQGAQMFKGAGLGAGIGMQNRMFTAGQSRQMVAGGAFSEQALDLYGGTEGVGQTMAELNAAYLSKVSQPLMPFLLGNRDADGNLTIDQKKVNQLTSGAISYEDALRQGSARDLRPGDMSDMLSQMKELTTQLGKQMGPEGVQRAAVQAAMDLNKSTGGAMGLRGAAMTMYGEAGGAIVGRMQDADYQIGVMAQMDKEMQRREFEADRAQRESTASTGFLARRGLDFEGPSAYFERAQAGYSDWMGGMEESRRLAAVGMTRFSRGAGYDGISNVKGLRGGQGSAAGYRSDTLSGPAGFLANWARPGAALITGGASELGVYAARRSGVVGAIDEGLGMAGNVIDEGMAIGGDERAMSRYLQNRSGMLGTIQDAITGGPSRAAIEAGLMGNIGTAGLGIAGKLGLFDALGTGQTAEERLAGDRKDVQAYRLAAKGDIDALKGGRQELAAMGIGGDVAGRIAAGQGRSAGWEKVASYALMTNPATMGAGVVNAGLQLAGVDTFGALGINLGESGEAIGDQRIADAAGISLSKVQGMSAEAKASLISDVRMRMTTEQRAEFDVTSRDMINLGETERIGKQYLRSGAAASKRVDEVLSKAGLDSYEDLSKAEKSALAAVAGSGTEENRKYMAIAALFDTNAADNKALAEQMFQQLQKDDPDGPEGAKKKLVKAQRMLTAMDSDARDALVSSITGLISGESSVTDMLAMGGAGALSHMGGTLAEAQDAMETAAGVERFAATVGKLAEVDDTLTSGVTDDAQLMDRIKNASEEDLANYREVLGAEAVQLALDGDSGSDADLGRFAELSAKATGAGSGKLDISQKRGASSDSTREQASNIAAQKAFFSDLNDSTRNNSSHLRNLTTAVKQNTDAMVGGGAENAKNRARGPDKRKH